MDFTGHIEIKKAGTYIYLMLRDDGGELTIAGQKIINYMRPWSQGQPTTSTGSIFLKAGIHEFYAAYN